MVGSGMAKTLRTPVVVGVAAVALVLGAGVATATTPPDADSCPAGYVSTLSNSSWVGAGVPGSDSATIEQEYNEVVGLGCFKRAGTKGSITFRWYTVGPIESGLFYYQVYDCTKKKVANSFSMAYENPKTKTTSGHASATATLVKSHKYAVRVTGGGTYKRTSDGFTGVVGHYASTAPDGIESFTTRSACK